MEKLFEMDDTYYLQYFGQTLIHSYYTEPMLPWIAEEISLAHRVKNVCLSLSIDSISVTIQSNAEVHSDDKHLSISNNSNISTEQGSGDCKPLSNDLISFEDRQVDFADDVNCNYMFGEKIFGCKYTDVVHARRVYCKKNSYLVLLVRETKESPIFCHAFKAPDHSIITVICNTVEERILRENKNGSSCNFSKLGSGEGNGNPDNDCVNFEVMLVGVVNMHNPNPPHSLIDDAVVQFNEKYSKIEQQHTVEEKGIRVRTSPTSRELFGSPELKIGSPSSYMDDSREGSIKMLQTMRQRCNSVEHTEKPQSIRRRQRHSSEPSTYANNSQRSRIRLFQIGRESIKLICPNKSTRTCEIEFSNISRCMQGIKCREHFGIIANKVEFSNSKLAQGNSPNHHTHNEKKIVCYIFKCDEDYVCEEIMQGIKQAFTSCMSNASPMRKYDVICKDINAASSNEALAIAKHKMKSLSDNEVKCIKAQLMEINPTNPDEKLAALMAALRQMYEVRHIEHMTAIKSTPDFGQESSQTLPVSNAFDNIKSKAMHSFGNLLQRGRKKMQELQQDAELISGHLSERSSVSPAQKFKFLTDSSNSAPNTPQKDSLLNGYKYSGFTRQSSSDSFDGMRRRSISLGSKPASMSQLKTTTPSMLIYHKIFQSVVNTGPLSCNQSSTSENLNISASPLFKEMRKSYDTVEEIRELWKWAIRQQILLKRINNITRTGIKETSNSNTLSQQDYTELSLVPSEMNEMWDELFSISMEEREKFDKRVLNAVVQKGLTCQYRGRIWKLLRKHCVYNAAVTNDLKCTDSYVKLLENLTPYQHAILIDIGRTFPSHSMYCQQLGPGQLSLFNVLKAYSLFDIEVGYCQGLSFIAGVLLMHTCVENEAYELLYCLMQEVGCRSMYLPDMKGMKLAIYKMSRLLHDIDSEIFEFFEIHEVSMMLVATPWFLTMFASTFPINFVARIFDMVFLEGTSALFKVSICLLQENRAKILKCKDFEEVVNFIRTDIPDSRTECLNRVIVKAMELNLGSKLGDYEVEYTIVQEEIPLNRQVAEKQRLLEEQIQCLESVNRTVTESNCGLLHQLQEAQQKVASLQKQLRDATK